MSAKMKGARVREQAITNDCFVETEMEKRRFKNVTMVCFFFLVVFVFYFFAYNEVEFALKEAYGVLF